MRALAGVAKELVAGGGLRERLRNVTAGGGQGGQVQQDVPSSGQGTPPAGVEAADESKVNDGPLRPPRGFAFFDREHKPERSEEERRAWKSVLQRPLPSA